MQSEMAGLIVVNFQNRFLVYGILGCNFTAVSEQVNVRIYNLHWILDSPKHKNFKKVPKFLNSPTQILHVSSKNLDSESQGETIIFIDP